MPGRASAKRYAQAMFNIALESGRVDQWADDLRAINEGLQTAELKAFLEHARVPLERKVGTIAEAFQGLDPLVLNLLSLIVSRGLVDLVPEVEAGYRQLLNEYLSIEQVEVRSAVPLEDGERERITTFLGALINKQVSLDARVDPTILGGLVIKVGDKLIDGSTRTRLGELGKQLRREVAPS